MAPVLILQHLSGDGPAYLATWLQAQGIAFEARNTEAGDAFPDDLHGRAAVAVLGGEMSANDDLPSLRRAEHLIRQAVDQGVPVLGHCLGGQLMARALGARVVDSPRPEVGWHRIDVPPSTTARHWFGDVAEQGHATVFQWHFEAFDLPPGAEAIAGNVACPHQAFAIGPHLAMQFHVEVDEEKLRRWVAEDGPRHRQAQQLHATVHGSRRMLDDTGRCLAVQQRLADAVYARWWSGRRRPG
jgi:GMP synthase (glutamine-hydrolysing)